MSAIKNQLAEQTDNLAKQIDDLFNDVASYAGYPKRPAHTCANGRREGAVITVYEDETAVSSITTPAWRDTEKHPMCRGCYHDRVVRLSQQIQAEQKRVGGLSWVILPNRTAVDRETARLRKKRERDNIDFVYRVFPLDGGEYVFISNQIDGHAMPSTNTQVYHLVNQWANTPHGMKISSSEGWGGNFQKTRGDGRTHRARKQGDGRRCVQLWTTTTIKQIAGRLDYKLAGGQDAFIKKQHVSQTAVALNGLELYRKGSNKPGMDALLNFFFPEENSDVTTYVHKDLEPMCLSRDIDGPEGAERAEGEKNPIYLPGLGVIK